jgi:hypothetical protein
VKLFFPDGIIVTQTYCGIRDMPKVLVTCQECGKTFETLQSEIKRGAGKYCSIECAGKSRIGEKNHKWKPKIKHICEECGKEFEVKPYQAKNGSRKYCSHECSEKAHSGEKNPNWKPKINQICGKCGKEFDVSPWVIKENRGGKYCSKSCQYKARSRLYSGSNCPAWKPKIKRVCEECGKEIEITPSQAKIGQGKYCSRACLAKAQSKLVGEKSPSWKGGMKKWICNQCGKEFQSKKKSPRFCSKDCKNRYQSIHNRGANNPFYKDKIKRICQTCGKEFEVHPSVVEHGHGKFCSKECMITRITKKCEECGKEITISPHRIKAGFGKYCSQACQGKARSKIYVGENHPNYKGKAAIVCQTCKKTFYVNQGRASVAKYCCMECSRNRIKRNCLLCGTEFEIPKSKIKGKRGYYCRPECYFKDRTNRFSGENSSSWLGGISFEPYCPKFNNEFRERVRTYYDYKCVLCKKTQEQNGKKLSVHHVNYQKNACCDEDIPLYFVALCNSCHTKTNHDREKYRKLFEKMIEKRFGGRSYFHKKEQLSHYGV